MNKSNETDPIENISVYSDIDIYIPPNTNIETLMNQTIIDLENGGSSIVTNIRILLQPNTIYVGNISITRDNVTITTIESATIESTTNATTIPATIMGSITVDDSVGVRFVKVHLTHPKNRCALRIINPLLNNTDITLITEVKCREVTIQGTISVINPNAHLHIYNTHIKEARGVGLLVENGGQCVVFDGCSISKCKVGVSVSNHQKMKSSFIKSTVHILTNDLMFCNNTYPNLEDDGGLICYYIEILQNKIFASPDEMPTVKLLLETLNEMLICHAIYPSGNINKWTCTQFVRSMQDLKEEMRNLWSHEINYAFARVMEKVAQLLELEKDE